MSTPFHDGERAAQEWAEVPQSSGAFIRPFMPEQHQEFFAKLPFVLVGSVDEQLQPTASLLFGPPGFVTATSRTALEFRAAPALGDPLTTNLRLGARLGVLGIEPHTRRRNRANGRVTNVDAARFSLEVEHSFGNCPKYITQRRVTFARGRGIGITGAGDASGASRFHTELTARERICIETSDTFFIASAHPLAVTSSEGRHGVDVSHRGGPPGFIKFISVDTFVVADFPGNDLFNTLGNVFENPKVGLIFLDFERRSVVQLHAMAKARKRDRLNEFGSNRELEFRIVQAQTLVEACPLASEEP
jgi:uncharacterized protein